ncbi:MAG TPA: hypothetical protein VGF84_04070 [Micromonosporaceae bacterium]|jgi:hypothetical protein
MRWLIRLYPARWRQRYGAELHQLVRDLRRDRSRSAVAIDLAKGAIGAHAHRVLDMPPWHWRTIRRGALIAGTVWLGLSAEIVLTNVVFPAPDDSGVEVLVSYLVVFAALGGIGVLAARSGAARRVQVLAGAVVGAVIGALSVVSFAIVDNIWLGTVSRQPQKIDGFAHSGAASMRAYINHDLIGPALFAVIALGIIGAIMGAVGGMVGERLRAAPATTVVQRLEE